MLIERKSQFQITFFRRLVFGRRNGCLRVDSSPYHGDQLPVAAAEDDTDQTQHAELIETIFDAIRPLPPEIPATDGNQNETRVSFQRWRRQVKIVSLLSTANGMRRLKRNYQAYLRTVYCDICRARP